MLPGRCEKKEEKTRSSDSGVSLDAPGGQTTGRLHEQYAAAIDRGEGAYERLLDFNGDGRITAADMDGAAGFIGAGKLDESIYD